VRLDSPAERLGGRVEVRDLTWRPFGRAMPVFERLHLTVEPGQRVLLAGPSGSGKSTLLRALAGVLTSAESGEASGTVTVSGAEPDSGAAGLLLQEPADAFVAGRAGRDVAFGLENTGVPRDGIRKRVDAALQEVGFPFGTDRAVRALSGGQAQRLALAGVLAMRPGLLLLDEPTSMLDPGTARVVREAIWDAVERSGTTVIVVEHHLDAWVGNLDRVIVLGRDGAVTADGPPRATLEGAGRALARDGVWIPGAPAPELLPVDPSLCVPLGARVPVGRVLVRATDAGLVRPVGDRLVPDDVMRPVQILTALHVEVRAGEIVALTGSSGAGKSSLAGLLAGLEAPSSGSVTAGAEFAHGVAASPAAWPPRELARRVGWVPQHAELAVVGRTVRDDAALTGRVLAVPAAASRAERLLEVLGLTACAQMDPHHLSGGQLRRLALADALAHGPSLLVLDEPTVGQDRQTWAAVVGVLHAARAAGVGVVVATHDPLLIAVADRSVRLEGGTVVVPAREGTASADEVPDERTTGGARPEAPAPRRGRRAPLAGRCGPLALLAASVLLMIGSIGVRSVAAGGAGVAAELVLAPFVVGLHRRVWIRVLPALVAMISILWSTWLLGEGHALGGAATAALRVGFFVLPGVLLVRFLDPSELGDHLAQRLRLPARPVVAAVAAVQRFEGLVGDWGRLRSVRRVRGLEGGRSPLARGRDLGATTFALLVQTLRMAARMAVAMDARGFSSPGAAGRSRTWAAGAPWLRSDTALVLLGVAVSAVPALVGLLLR
jgi:energy-coupling factor transporter ATP-binding protein EcfA2